jgi:hypothetical protein
MRSGWPHTQEEPGPVASHQQANYGPVDSWPDGYPALGRDDGDYRYQQQYGVDPYSAQPYVPAAGEGGGYPYSEFGGHGRHAQAGNYAAPDAYGYGDTGYGNPGYDAPSAQDTGIPSHGFVDASGPYAGSDLAYPTHGAPVGEQAGQSADVYHQPWDYSQPLRYDDEPAGSPQMDAYGQTAHPQQAFSADGFGSQDFGSQDGYGAPGFSSHGLHAAPVMNEFQGGGYDQPGYDQPGYGRLSYDDPRYDSRFGGGVDQFAGEQFGTGQFDAGQFGGGQFDTGDHFDAFGGSGTPGTDTRFDMPAVDDAPRHNDTRFDMPAVEDTPRHNDTRFDMPAVDDNADAFQVDHFWPGREEVSSPGSSGFGSGGFGTANQTSMDLAGDRKNDTRFDMPAVDDFSYGDRFAPPTSADGMPALDEFASGGAPEFRAANTGGLVVPADEQPMNWADETSFDRYADDFGAGASGAFQAAPESQPFAIPESGPMPAAAGTGAQRKMHGKRRGHSRDKREWIALGAIAVVAAGAIGGVMMKFVFSGPSGPQHTVATPEKIGDFTQQPSLGKQMKVDQLKSSVMAKGAGKISDPVASVYQQGSSAIGSDPETYIFVGGKLANADPVAEVDNFRKTSPGAKFVKPGMDGDEACGTATVSGESVAMCVWFDNDTFGEFVSPTMKPAQLGTTMNQARPKLEQASK